MRPADAQGLIHFHQANDPRGERNLRSRQLVRVAGAIPAFVMASRHFRRQRQARQFRGKFPGHGHQYLRTHRHMRLHSR